MLRDGGHYLLAIWDRIERNRADRPRPAEHDRQLFPDNPPMFMKRGPFSYHEPEWIERDLHAAGFDNVEIETVELRSRSPSAARCRAAALCYGSPMRVELIEEHGPAASTGCSQRCRAGARAVRRARRLRRADVGAHRDRD